MESSLRKPFTDAEWASLQERNKERAQAAIRALGQRYAHHPANHVPRRQPAPMGGALC